MHPNIPNAWWRKSCKVCPFKDFDLCSSLMFAKFFTHIYIVSPYSYHLRDILYTQMQSASFILPVSPLRVSGGWIPSKPGAATLLLWSFASVLIALLSSPSSRVTKQQLWREAAQQQKFQARTLEGGYWSASNHFQSNGRKGKGEFHSFLVKVVLIQFYPYNWNSSLAPVKPTFSSFWSLFPAYWKVENGWIRPPQSLVWDRGLNQVPCPAKC